jgi:acetolactate synthase-1/2/3 large subunit
MLKGTESFIQSLIQEGVDTVFGYPGGYAIDIFDELYKQNQIEVILPRHEQALIHAAEGYAKSTGKTGVCLVTSGPGATNLVTGIADANYDSIPLVCFTGQVPTGLIGNDAFQEVDIIGITRSICKYGVTVRNRKDLPRIIKEAFYIARTGKPGPVIVDLPKDVMLESYEDEFPTEVSIRGYKPNTSVHIGQIKRALDLIETAKRPLFLAGGGIILADARESFAALVNQTHIPVVTTIMGRGSLPTDHDLFIGNLGMHGSYAANMAVSQCDVLFSIGTRFNDRITGKVSEFAKNAKIIHIDIEAASISRNIKVDIPIVADAKMAIEALIERCGSYIRKDWLEQLQNWKKEQPLEMEQTEGLTPLKILSEINNRYCDGIIVTDVGQHQMWTTQFLKMTQNTKLITSGGLGTMGFGFPASIGAKLGNPDKTVLCISGDGGMQMNIQEFATAVANELPIIICIFNNNYLGMVRQWQQLFYGGRYSSTCLRKRKSCEKNCMNSEYACPPYTPDFIKLAESYGAAGRRVFKPDEIKDAFDFADLNTKIPTVLEFIIDRSELVLPMVPGGRALNDMVLDC